MRKFVTILLVFVLGAAALQAQSVSVQAYLDSTQLLIGDQTYLRLELSQPVGVKVSFPLLSDEIVPGLEIVEQSFPDTIKRRTKKVTLQKNFLITVFDSGTYQIPPFEVLLDHNGILDTLRSNSLVLRVDEFPVDTTKTAVYDINQPYNTPYNREEFIQRHLIYVIIALVALIALLLVRRYLKKRNADDEVQEPQVPLEPAHIIALRDLNVLESEKLWQKDKVKLYYSRLTDIVRNYLHHRYGVYAMERTSHEIFEIFKHNGLLDGQSLENLRTILTSADFVKFAKATPLANENETAFANAYAFVQATKLEENLRKEG